MKESTMTTWLVEYFRGDPAEPSGVRETPCFRIVSAENPNTWIAQVNGTLPFKAQEEVALLIAETLSQILGV
jgi:hypothetical protein